MYDFLVCIRTCNTEVIIIIIILLVLFPIPVVNSLTDLISSFSSLSRSLRAQTCKPTVFLGKGFCCLYALWREVLTLPSLLLLLLFVGFSPRVPKVKSSTEEPMLQMCLNQPEPLISLVLSFLKPSSPPIRVYRPQTVDQQFQTIAEK